MRATVVRGGTVMTGEVVVRGGLVVTGGVVVRGGRMVTGEVVMTGEVVWLRVAVVGAAAGERGLESGARLAGARAGAGVVGAGCGVVAAMDDAGVRLGVGVWLGAGEDELAGVDIARRCPAVVLVESAGIPGEPADRNEEELPDDLSRPGTITGTTFAVVPGSATGLGSVAEAT